MTALPLSRAEAATVERFETAPDPYADDWRGDDLTCAPVCTEQVPCGVCRLGTPG